jgi:hypothetical protein
MALSGVFSWQVNGYCDVILFIRVVMTRYLNE